MFRPSLATLPGCGNGFGISPDETVQITKTCERMYALLAICTTLSPGPSDESIMSIVKEHYGDQLSLMQRGG